MTSHNMSGFSTLVELLQYRASESSGASAKPAFTYLNDGEHVSGSLSFAELDRQARSIAAHLQQVVRPGARALLVYPPSLDYIVAFFGCLYAGVIAIPAVPPANARTRPRLLAIVQDATPDVALGPASTVEHMGRLEPGADDPMSRLNWLATDGLADFADRWQRPDLKSSDLAFLQYTSGSTGTPKGVMVSHENLLANAALSQKVYGIDEPDVLVSWLPPHHDFGLIGGIVCPLFVGCHCVQFPPSVFFARPYRWLKLLSHYRARVTGAPNFAYDMCVRKVSDEQMRLLDLRCVEVAINGAERIRYETLQRFAERFARCGFKAEALTPAYGLAESTLFVAAHTRRVAGQLPPSLTLSKHALAANRMSPAMDSADEVVLVSHGLARHDDHRAIIVEPQTRRRLNDDQVGEIWVRGPSVANGYWQRAQESQAAFGATPEGASDVYLRSGDLGFIHEDALYIAGRLKEMMIFNGRNVYPQDVEVIVERLDPAFRTNGCAAFALEDRETTRLVIVQEIESRKTADTADLIDRLRTELAVQHELYALEAVLLVKAGHLPRTSSGKIQRKRCAALYAASAFSCIWSWISDDTVPNREAAPHVAPRTDTERMACDIWQSVLDVECVGIDDNFFALGGHSLLATQVASRLRDAFQIEFPLRTLFEAPTVRALARRIELAGQAEPPAAPPIQVADRRQPLPLSFAQQRLWFLDQFERNSAFYNIPAALRLTGKLDISALHDALNEIVRRHEVLRTRFATCGDAPTQVIAPQLRLELPVVDLTHLPAHERQAHAQSRVQDEAWTPFDLAAGPLIRAGLIRIGPDEHIVMLSLHHIVSDGWSMGVLVNEVAALYHAFAQGLPSPLPELRIQYADYAQWQRHWLSGAELQRQTTYWRAQLDNSPTLLNLPTDRPRPPLQTHRGASLDFDIDAPTTAALKALSQQHRCTLFMTLLAAFDILLSRYAGQHDICVGTPIANRSRVEIEPLVGFFVNTLVLRSRVDQQLSFTELLTQVRTTTLDAYAHQDLPFEQLVETLNPERHTSHAPLFQVMLALQNTAMGTLELPGLTLQQLPADSITAKFDLTLNLEELDERLQASFEYNTDLFDATTIERMAEHMTVLLAAIAADPAARILDLPMLTPPEHHRLLVEWNDTTADIPRASIQQLFETQAADTPENLAVVFEGNSLTFAELNARANQLAHHLRDQSVGPDILVGICVERSLDMIVGLLAILKAGGAYVPLDPGYPPERIAYMLEDAKPAMLLTQQHLLPRLVGLADDLLTFCLDAQWPELARHGIANPANRTRPDNLAYVIYTSGSTGKPKGVCVSHQSVVNVARSHQANIHRQLKQRPARVSFNAPYAFDASVSEFILLLDGHTLFIVPEEVRLSPPALQRFLINHRLHAFDTNPAQLKYLLEQGADTPLPEIVMFGGEAIDADLWRKLKDRDGSHFFNAYGPTECTIDVAICPVREGPDAPSIGKPEANTRIYLLDAQLNPVPVGVAGDLYIAGAGLARGYLNRPDLTADKFLPNPFSATPGARMYQSGDLARYLPDGNIEYLGRSDNQVKIRGFRIELGEIEAALAALPEVAETVVLAREDHPGDRRLAAYLVARAGHVLPGATELREQLLQRLPGYMVPAHFTELQRMPVTPNGKIDRHALPAPDASLRSDVRVAPDTPTEIAVARIWADALKLDEIGANDNFFALGGHSLLATQVASRLRDAFQIEFPLRTLFEAPTVRALARRIELAGQAEPPAAPPIQVADRRQPLPLSFAQQRLWFLDQFERNSAFYNIPAALRLTGKLDISALHDALNEIVRRHEVLRTRFATCGDAPTQVIAPQLRLELPVVDLTHLPAHERQAHAQSRVQDEAWTPFDLAAGPLIRAGLIRIGPDEHIVMLSLHHIVSDGWSMGVLVNEVAALYHAFAQGLPSPLPELRIQYADYAQWQRHWLSGAELQRQTTYWRAQLDNSPTLLNLPTDRPRPPLQTHRGASLDFDIDAPTTAALKALSQQHRCTLFMTLLAAFDILLSRYAGQHDICVGTPIANRSRVEIEPLVGFFVNTLVLRSRVDQQLSFTELLTQVRTTTLDAYAHQDLPFEQLVETLNPERHTSHAPLFQVMLALQNTAMGTLELPGLTLQQLPADSITAKFDLTLNLEELDERLQASFEYNTDLFDATTIERMAEHMTVLLAAIAADPAARILDLPMLTPPEHHRLLVEWNDTTADIPRASIQQLFETQAADTPENLAVVFEGNSLTFAELNARANQLAHHLRDQSVGPDILVGICVERSLDMIVGLLAILKAGGAYVPLDPGYPPERIAYMLEDAKPAMLLTQQHLLPRLVGLADDLPTFCLDAQWPELARHGIANPANRTRPDNLAYVIYTSGSTGKPKGVCISHRCAINLWAALSTRIHQRCSKPIGMRVALNASISFDASVQQWLTLLNGACLYLIPEQLRKDPESMAETIAGWELDVLDCTPSQLPLLLASRYSERLARCFLIGGEAIDQKLWSTLQNSQGASFHNVYGPTETTVDTVTCDIHASVAKPVLGRPIDNAQVYILDAYLNPVPVGVAGDLYIAGAGLARGYLNRPDLTADKFLPNPFSATPGARMYQSGDLARYLPDGNIEYLGRSDNQVKIRGFRIELGEIEAALAALPEVAETVVLAREDHPGDRRLAAYLVARAGHVLPGATELREQLLQRLPGYMVPAHFTELQRMPVTPNGKIDRHALPAPDASLRSDVRVAPDTPTEIAVARIWADALKLDEIGANDNFFALGGHSLLATQVASRLRDAFQIEFPLRTLFEKPQLDALSAEIDAMRRASATCRIPPLSPQPRSAPLPLSYAQERLWLLEQIETMGSAYNIAGQARIRGTLDDLAFERALHEIVRRHETLRTRFVADDDAIRQLIAAPGGFALERVDLSSVPTGVRQAEADDAIREVAMRRFDLASGALFRAALLRLSPNEHVAVVVMHHIISDGWSLGVLIRELSALYTAYSRNHAAALPDLPVQYADYALWQRSWLRGDVLERQIEYWKQRLAGIPAALELPLDRPRPPVQSFRGASLPFTLPAALSSRLHAFARAENATLFMVLLAAFQHLLSRWSGQDDIVIGTPVAGRTDPHTETLIGFFINILVLRTDVSGTPSLRELLARAKETSLQAYGNQDLPFEKLVEELNPIRDLSRSPVFQVMINLIPAGEQADGFNAPGLETDARPAGDVSARFELMLRLCEEGDSIACHLEYATDLFDATTIERFAEHYRTLLDQAVAEPDRPLCRLSLLSEAERHQLSQDWNVTPETPDPLCVHQLFSRQAACTPDACALKSEHGAVSYSALDMWSNAIARQLQVRGAGPGFVAGLVMYPSPTTVAALLGILKAGAICVPLDPAYPDDALRVAIAECGARLVLGDAGRAATLASASCSAFELDAPEDRNAPIASAPPDVPVTLEDIACALPVWNTPGTRKMARVTHLGMAQQLRTLASRLAAEPRCAFSPTVHDVLLPLMAGAPLLLAPCDGIESAADAGPQPDFPQATPASDAIANWIAASGRAYVLDRHLNPTPPNVIGDLYIGGKPWARGYVGHDDLSSADFSPSPFVSGEWLFRVGELARRRADGDLEIAGQPRRTTINGRYIDLGEIESALMAYLLAGQVAVAKREDPSGHTQLVAYVELHDAVADAMADLDWRAALATRLPADLIPADIVRLESLPLTPRGTIDWDALPAPGQHTCTAYEAPRTPIECSLASIWADVLGVERIGRGDNFFDLGGHSLLATLVVARLREMFDIDVSLRALFEARTLHALAELVENIRWTRQAAPAADMQHGIDDEIGSI
ncbi:amino acid adenylation domain-containing protein [Burkholderia metallica]